jgi:hypothetical protein
VAQLELHEHSFEARLLQHDDTRLADMPEASVEWMLDRLAEHREQATSTPRDELWTLRIENAKLEGMLAELRELSCRSLRRTFALSDQRTADKRSLLVDDDMTQRIPVIEEQSCPLIGQTILL